MALSTLPALLADRAATAAEVVILRHKDRGIWKPVTWAMLAARVAALAGALAADGFSPGDTGAVLSDARVEWVMADLALQTAGGASAGLSPLADAATLTRQLREIGATTVFVENEEQLDKLWSARAACPALRRIVVFDMKGLRGLDDAAVVGLPGFTGSPLPPATPPAEAPAAILLTEGRGRKVPQSHRQLADTLAAAAARFTPQPGAARLAMLPPSCTAERVLGLYLSLATGTVTHFGESADTLEANLREVQPKVLLAAPAQWKRFHDRATRAAAAATLPQRALLRGALRLAHGGAGGIARPVLTPLRRALGLERLRLALVVGGAMAPELHAWFRALGIDPVEIYGLAECAGFAATPGRAGPAPVPLRVSTAGEIEIDAGGWIATGDAGAVTGGVLHVSGRCADALALPGGGRLHPEPIERALGLSPLILGALVRPGPDGGLHALLWLDAEAVEAWAHARRLMFANYAALAALPEVAASMQPEIDRVNAGLARAYPIRAFRVLDRRLGPGDPELTELGALRRGAFAAVDSREPATTEETS